MGAASKQLKGVLEKVLNGVGHPWVQLSLLCGMMTLVALLKLQEPRAYMPVVDLIPDLNNAYGIVNHLDLPLRGCVSSYGGANPPGVTLGLLPGVVLFPRDPYLAKNTGALLLLGLTLLGFFFFFRRFPNPFVFIFTSLCYTLSTTGFFFAESLWPRAHPAFAVWFGFFLAEWVSRRDPAALPRAILVWIIGMFWFMEIAPLVLVVPVLYLLFRPPLDFKRIVAHTAIGLILWTPYLVYQYARDGFDLKRNIVQRERPEERRMLFDGQLANKDLRVISERPPGWQPDWSLEQTAADRRGPELEKKRGRFVDDPAFGRVWVREQEEEGFGGTGHYLRLVENGNTWCFQRNEDGVLLAKGESGWKDLPVDHFIKDGTPVARGLRLNALLDKSLLFVVPGWGRVGFLVLAGLSIAAALVAPWRRRFQKGKPGKPAGPADSSAAQSLFVLALCFLIPHLVISILVPSHEWFVSGRRYYWLSSTLLPVVMGGLAFLSRRTVWQAIGFPALALMVCFACLMASEYRLELGKLVTEGLHFKKQHECYDVMDYLDAEVERMGLRNPSIGYDISFPLWILANRHNYGGSYKIGWDFDTVLRYRYGIENANTLPEGVAPDDDFRIVELHRWEDPWDWPWYFDLSEYPEMDILKTWGQYALLGRRENEAKRPGPAPEN